VVISTGKGTKRPSAALNFSKRYGARGETEELGGRTLGTLRESQVMGQHISGAQGDDTHDGLGFGNALQDIEDRAIAATGEDRVASGADGSTGLTSGRASIAGGFEENLNPGTTKDFRNTAHGSRTSLQMGSRDGIEQQHGFTKNGHQGRSGSLSQKEYSVRLQDYRIVRRFQVVQLARIRELSTSLPGAHPVY
jgi:hypothetical protein